MTPSVSRKEGVVLLCRFRLKCLDAPAWCMYTVRMKNLAFEWDPAKDQANQRKHGVSFDEASTVFLDGDALLIYDPVHSGSEDRFLILGLGRTLRLLVVCHCYRTGDAIRIISARKSNALESRHYWSRK